MEKVNLLSGGIVDNRINVLPGQILFTFIPGETATDRGHIINYETRGGQVNFSIYLPVCKMNYCSIDGVLYRNALGSSENDRSDYLHRLTLNGKNPIFLKKM